MIGGNREFHLYTIGIADWGNINPDESVLKVWNDILLPKIIELLLRANFTRIIVHHHDILEDFDNRRKNNFQRNINQILSQKDTEINSSKSLIESTFIKEPIDFHQISYPHLIFDFAHLFDYMYIPGHNKSVPIIRETKEIMPRLNVIYFGYLGEREQLFSRGNNGKKVPLIELIESDFVSIDESGVVITYIDKISQKQSLTSSIIKRSPEYFIISNSNNINIFYPGDVISKIYLLEVPNSPNGVKTKRFNEFMQNY